MVINACRVFLRASKLTLCSVLASKYVWQEETNCTESAISFKRERFPPPRAVLQVYDRLNSETGSTMCYFWTKSFRRKKLQIGALRFGIEHLITWQILSWSIFIWLVDLLRIQFKLFKCIFQPWASKWSWPWTQKRDNKGRSWEGKPTRFFPKPAVTPWGLRRNYT